MRPYIFITGIIFALVSLAHLFRLLYAFPIIIGPYTLPMWLSWIGMFVSAALAIWAGRLGSTKRT